MWFRKKRKPITDGNDFNKELVNIFCVDNVFEISLMASVGDVPKAYVGFYLDKDQSMMVLELLGDSKWRISKDEISEFCS